MLSTSDCNLSFKQFEYQCFIKSARGRRKHQNHFKRKYFNFRIQKIHVLMFLNFFLNIVILHKNIECVVEECLGLVRDWKLFDFDVNVNVKFEQRLDGKFVSWVEEVAVLGRPLRLSLAVSTTLFQNGYSNVWLINHLD